MTPTLYLCIDLMPKPGTVVPDGETIAQLLAESEVNGDGYVRDWQVFPTPEAATAYAEGRPTLVVLPLEITGPWPPS